MIPGLVLQAFAIALVAAYYWHAPTRSALDGLAAVKSRFGYAYSMLSTALFGGAIPFLYMRLNSGTRKVTPGSHGPFYLAFWAYKGFEVDLFYRIQGWLFGNLPTPRTIAEKVVVDQFVYCVLISMPFTVIAFFWKDTGFDWKRLRALNLPGFLKATLPVALLGTWIVWIPAVTVIYCLPPALQIPLFNIVLCFYALMIAALNARNAVVGSAVTPVP
ncbi:MAG: hypothetical protein JF616_04800 [Fibrobacteres bacterium]|jgi:hypothetical protein|nr:hypothetical protein [Fibrobacterota bacterium]